MSIIGQNISGYIVKKEIGRGGMGVVYLCEHATLKTKIAIKVLYPRFSADTELRKRFKREAVVQNIIKRHPKLVELINYIEQDGNSYILMEYFNSRPLSEVIGNEVGPVPHERAIPIFEQLLEGIGYAHKMGVIHRDIKPSNILINDKDEVKITDFGIAKPTETSAELAITKAGTIIGTPYYMSPEQIQGFEATEKSDIYSLGITFYETLCGRLPFNQKSDFEVRQAQVKANPPDPRDFYEHIPKKLVHTVLKALEKDTKKRQQSCKEFSTEIKASIKKEPILVPPKSPKVNKPSSPTPVIIGIVGAFAFLLISVILSENEKAKKVNSSIKSSTTYLTYYIKGKEYYDDYNWDNAISEFDKAIKLKYDHYDSRWYRGDSYYQKDKYNIAEKDANFLISRRGSSEDYHLRGRIKFKKEEYESAKNDFSSAININKNEEDYYFGRGITKWALGENSKALGDFTKAISINKNFSKAYYFRGYIYKDMNKLKKSCDDWVIANKYALDVSLKEAVQELINEHCR